MNPLKDLRGIIYGIENIITGKIYVGQTKSSFYDRYGAGRWWDYCSKRLKASIRKYGISAFRIIILKHGLSKIELNFWESYYIELYESTNNLFGYNLLFGGDSRLQSEQARQINKNAQIKAWKNPNNIEKWKFGSKNRWSKIEERLKTSEGVKNYHKRNNVRIKHSKERGGIPFSVFNQNNELIGRFQTQIECCEQLNLSTSKVSQCLSGQRPHHKGYIFKRDLNYVS
jgi:group I intron endonuclease